MESQEKQKIIEKALNRFWDEDNPDLSDDLKVAISLAIDETERFERRNQREGLCTNCGEKDELSESVICGKCIKNWKKVLQQKAKQELWDDPVLDNSKLIGDNNEDVGLDEIEEADYKELKKRHGLK